LHVWKKNLRRVLLELFKALPESMRLKHVSEAIERLQVTPAAKLCFGARR
jgi:hypothetical protein